MSDNQWHRIYTTDETFDVWAAYSSIRDGSYVWFRLDPSAISLSGQHPVEVARVPGPFFKRSEALQEARNE